MKDRLLDLAQNRGVQRVFKALGLPLSLPRPLRRAQTPLSSTPLSDRDVALALGDSLASEVALNTLQGTGARVRVSGSARLLERHSTASPFDPSELTMRSLDALVFDACDLTRSADLERLHAFFKPGLKALRRDGRVVVIGRPTEGLVDPGEAAAQAALDGFVRSVAREVGGKGASANLLRVEPGAEARLEGPLRFLLSPRSAYITGQSLRLSAAPGAPSGADRTRPLAGKRVVVTGAARGIGASIARAVAREGGEVIGVDRPEGEDRTLEGLMRELGGRALSLDVTDEAAPARLCDALEGGVDVVIHNAGVTRDRTLARMDVENWRLTLGVNLIAVERINAALIEGERLRENGRVLCLSSVAGIAGNIGQTNYASAKAGLLGYCTALSAQLASRGVTVNALAPGFIETRMTAEIPAMIREIARRMNCFGQGGQPEDVAEAALFLASPGAAGITGQSLRVCGGAFVGR